MSKPIQTVYLAIGINILGELLLIGTLVGFEFITEILEETKLAVSILVSILSLFLYGYAIGNAMINLTRKFPHVWIVIGALGALAILVLAVLTALVTNVVVEGIMRSSSFTWMVDQVVDSAPTLVLVFLIFGGLQTAVSGAILGWNFRMKTGSA